MVESQTSETVDILFGIEADYYSGCEDFLKPWLKEQDFDIVIGSVHFIREWGFDNPAEIRIWDAVDVTEFKRKHTANVGESLREITRMIEQLVNRRDERRDAFAATIANAMKTKLGEDADEVLKILQKHGITKTLGNEALKIAEEQGQFTIFSVVDALTRLAGQCENAGERTALDVKGSSLLALAV